MKRSYGFLSILYISVFFVLIAAGADPSLADEPHEINGIRIDRLAERICELGYSNAPAASLKHETILEFLSGDLYDVPVSPASLFSYDAPYALLTGKKDGFFIGATPHATTRIDAEAAGELLTAGTAYTLTDEKTGIQVKMKYVGAEGSASVFSSGSRWDAATLTGDFEEFFDYRTREFSIRIGEESYLVYCQIPPSFMQEDVPVGCLLYWSRPAGLTDLLSASLGG